MKPLISIILGLDRWKEPGRWTDEDIRFIQRMVWELAKRVDGRALYILESLHHVIRERPKCAGEFNILAREIGENLIPREPMEQALSSILVLGELLQPQAWSDKLIDGSKKILIGLMTQIEAHKRKEDEAVKVISELHMVLEPQGRSDEIAPFKEELARSFLGRQALAASGHFAAEFEHFEYSLGHA